MARNESRRKLGHYPLPEVQARRIRQFLVFSPASTAIDPCVGTGAALRTITDDTGCRLYGVELDSLRAAAASEALDQVVHGSVFETHCAVDSFSLLFLNPPYDDEQLCDEQPRRTEGVFLEWCYRWLQPGGVLILVIPARRLPSCTTVLSAQFRDVSGYRLTSPEAAQYEQVVIFAVRRNRRERERLTDSDVARGRQTLSEMVLYRRMMPLGESGRTYAVPPSDGSVRLVYRGLPLDTIEDMLPDSRAYWQASRAIFAPQVQIAGRPLSFNNFSGVGKGGTGTLKVDGKVVDTKRMEKTIPIILQWDESFDIGQDTITGVNDADYLPPFPLTAKFNKLTIKIDRPQLSPEDVKKLEAGMKNAAMGIQ